MSYRSRMPSLRQSLLRPHRIGITNASLIGDAPKSRFTLPKKGPLQAQLIRTSPTPKKFTTKFRLNPKLIFMNGQGRGKELIPNQGERLASKDPGVLKKALEELQPIAMEIAEEEQGSTLEREQWLSLAIQTRNMFLDPDTKTSVLALDIYCSVLTIFNSLSYGGAETTKGLRQIVELIKIRPITDDTAEILEEILVAIPSSEKNKPENESLIATISSELSLGDTEDLERDDTRLNKVVLAQMLGIEAITPEIDTFIDQVRLFTGIELLLGRSEEDLLRYISVSAQKDHHPTIEGFLATPIKTDVRKARESREASKTPPVTPLSREKFPEAKAFFLFPEAVNEDDIALQKMSDLTTPEELQGLALWIEEVFTFMDSSKISDKLRILQTTRANLEAALHDSKLDEAITLKELIVDKIKALMAPRPGIGSEWYSNLIESIVKAKAWHLMADPTLPTTRALQYERRPKSKTTVLPGTQQIIAKEDIPLAPSIRDSAYGREELFPEYDKQKAVFVGKAETKGIPKPEAERLFDKVVENVRCVDPYTLRRTLEEMKTAIEIFTADTPYVFALLKGGASEDYIYEKLMELGLKTPVGIIYKRRGTNDFAPHDIEFIKERDLKVVVVDDAMISGSQMKETLSHLTNVRIPRNNIFMGAVAKTDDSIVFYPAIASYIGTSLPGNITKIFTSDELRTLETILNFSTQALSEVFQYWTVRNNNLGFIWYKMHDLLADSILYSLGIVTLNGFMPPYYYPSLVVDYPSLLQTPLPPVDK